MNEQELLEEIARLKGLATRRSIKKTFKDAYKRWYNIMVSPNDLDTFSEFTVFFTTITIAAFVAIMFCVTIVWTKGLTALPLLAYPIWVLFRREE